MKMRGNQDTLWYIYILRTGRDILNQEVRIVKLWDDIMTAQEASIKLGKNPKYVYFLWKRGSNMLLKDSVQMKGSTLLITRQGFEHLSLISSKEDNFL